MHESSLSLLFYTIKAKEKHEGEECLLVCGLYYMYLNDDVHFNVHGW